MEETTSTNDEELISRYYQADQEALKMLFKRHKDGLFNFALRFVGNRADAEDAVSHTFMMVCEKRYAIKPGASFKTWAYTVAHNICLSRLRSKSRFFSLWSPKSDPDHDQAIDVVDPKDTARDQLSSKEILNILNAKEPSLPKNTLMIFLRSLRPNALCN